MAFTDLPQSGIHKARTVMLAELEGPMLSRMSEAEMAAMRAYTQLASTAVWVTNGDVLAGREPEKTLVFGISKSIMTEQPSFHLASIDIDPDAALASSARLVVDMEAEFRRNPHDMNTELVEKGGVVYSSRYIVDDDGNAAFARSWMPPTERLPIRGNLSMGFDRVGRLDSFHFEDVSGAETALGETDVLVEARAFAFDQTVRTTSFDAVVMLTLARVSSSQRARRATPSSPWRPAASSQRRAPKSTASVPAMPSSASSPTRSTPP